MPFNINEFKNTGLQLGGARPSLFEVQLSLPKSLGINIDSTFKLRFTCRASSIPASSVASFEVPYFGRKIKLAGDRTFADWNVTVMNDEDFAVRDMFEQWSQAINHNELNFKNHFGNNYKSADATVFQYSKGSKGTTGTPIAAYTFIGLFPTEISTMDLDWDATNSVQTFNVTFAYDYYINARNDLGQSAGRPASVQSIPRVQNFGFSDT